MTSTTTSRILPLTSWRGIFCICIALFHSQVQWMTEMTGAGVVFFFIASGFLLGFHHAPDEMRGATYRGFLKNRVFRIFPLHWLSLALLLAISFTFHYDAHIIWPAFVPNVLLLQSYIPIKAYFFSFNSVSWFLSSLLFCYVLYPFVGRGLKKLSLKVQVAIMLVLVALYWLLMAQFTTGDHVTYITHINPIARLFEFSMGIVAFHCYEALKVKAEQWTSVRRNVVEVLVLVFFFGLVFFSENWTSIHKDAINDSVMWEIPMVLLILVLALHSGREGFIGRILCWKPLVWLGEMSLELFLLQGIAGLIFNYFISPVFGHFGFPTYEYYAVGLLPVLIILSWLIHRYFTLPINRWVRQKEAATALH